jgi:Effector Associated Constant Component 1
MDVLVSVVGGSSEEAELRQMVDWIRREKISGVSVVHVTPPIPEGSMGTLSDIVEILGPGGAGAALALSLQTWLSTRHKGVSVKLRRKDGSTLEIEQSNTSVTSDLLSRFLDS